MNTQTPNVVVGGGLVGSLLSVFLARRHLPVAVFERRLDMRSERLSGGRSINLVVTSRGIAALAQTGLWRTVKAHAVPVLGRMMHAVNGDLTYQPYGKDRSEANYSISRGDLNRILISAGEEAGAHFHFGHHLVRTDFSARLLEFECAKTGKISTITADRVFGADGAASQVRRGLIASGSCECHQEDLGHGYKELLIPAGPDGTFQVEPNALHIWPRGHFMLMALPNRDGSFTVTLYLPLEGSPSFASLRSSLNVRDLFTESFPDAVALIPSLVEDFFDNPTGHLGTIRCLPWNLRDAALLVGDAAHAIVPFFGQGMNCGFEDCSVLEELLVAYGEDWLRVFREFGRTRKPNADAIADMALENFREMRDHVGDPSFLLRKSVEHRLEREIPHEYRSRYSMVSYSLIPYRVAEEAGRIQARILSAICEGLEDPDEVDLERARTLIRDRLTPFLEAHGVDLDY